MLSIDITDLFKIGFAVVAGGLIGFEREFRDKAAGLRTLIFICLGSTAFTILSAKMALDRDPTRIAANIVTGIGFLGAGAILQDRGRVMGLTTAATIWLTAALGMVIGGGQYFLAFTLLATALIILWFFPMVELWISKVREERDYEVVCDISIDREAQLRTEFRRCGLRAHSFRQRKVGSTLHFYWRASGPRRCHEQFIAHLLASPDVKEFHV